MKIYSQLFFAITIGISAVASAAYGGGTPVADVWVSVEVTPSAFQPLSTGVIELTMHNNGPDTAGTGVSGGFGIEISQRAFLLTNPSLPPPYLVLPGATGCGVIHEVFGPNVNMLWGFIWSFYFPPIPAGEIRTCRIPIQFTAEPFQSFDTNWRILSTPEDPDLTNNTVNYRFVAGIPLEPAMPVSAIDRWAMWLAALGVLALARNVLIHGRRESKL